MKFGIYIDQPKSVEWGFNPSEAILFAFYYNLPSWAEHIFINGDVHYFASRFKVVEDLPILTDKPDTVYRLTRSLESKGVIHWTKFDSKDLIRITEKGKEWNNSEKNPRVGKKSEYSEKNPTELGKFSEQTRKKIRENSENFPTYNNTIDNSTIDTITIDNKSSFFSDETENSKKPTSTTTNPNDFQFDTEGVDVTTLNTGVKGIHNQKKDGYLLQLQTDLTVLTTLTERTKLTVEQVLSVAEGFATDQINKEQFLYPVYKEFKSHFYNWLLRQNPQTVAKKYLKNESTNSTGDTGANVNQPRQESRAERLARQVWS